METAASFEARKAPSSYPTILGEAMETSASFEAQSAPLPYPTFRVTTAFRRSARIWSLPLAPAPVFAKLAGGHRFAGILYPYARTCIYVIFLSSLVVLLANSHLACSRRPWRKVGDAAMAVTMVIAFLYILELRWQWYGDWRFDAGTGSLMRSLSAERHSSPPPVRLGVSWVLQPSVEFYRDIYHIDWLLPVTRDLPSCEDDYILLTFLDRGMVDTLGLEVLRRDQVSGAILAKRTTQSCASKEKPVEQR